MIWFLPFLVFIVAVTVVAVVLENVFTDRKFRRGLLIGGGLLAFAACLWAWPAGLSTLLIAIAAVIVVAGGLAYGLAKLHQPG